MGSLDVAADIRWRDWQARGVIEDRERSTTMTAVAILVAVGLAVWFYLQLI
jgi:hypothetical protein